MTRIGLVLGAGGVTGEAFHRGVLWALKEAAGFDARDAEVIVGTSAGSLVGASLRCSGMPARPVAALVEEQRIPRRPDPRPIIATLRRPWNARAGVLATALLPTGSRPMDAIVDGLRRRCGDGWPERELYVCAVRRRDGRRVVFGQPDAPSIGLASAVAASCAIPGYFRPLVHEGETYVDGGVHSPTNADVLAGRGLDLVVISSPMSVERHAIRAKLDLSARLLWHRYVVAERRALERAGTLVLAIEPGGDALRALGVNAMKAMNVDAIEETARQATLDLLARPEKAGRLALLRGSRAA
ncbi:MAG TPA: patatin-like phospholipase family protein [Frankiaceae bacterium]|nr:patatin-like phospholipase family protein [Frankiaceae bacterium]